MLIAELCALLAETDTENHYATPQLTAYRKLHSQVLYATQYQTNQGVPRQQSGRTDVMNEQMSPNKVQ